MKIEIIENTSQVGLKMAVNSFLKNHRLEIFDIKYEVYLFQGIVTYSCMVIYREV